MHEQWEQLQGQLKSLTDTVGRIQSDIGDYRQVQVSHGEALRQQAGLLAEIHTYMVGTLKEPGQAHEHAEMKKTLRMLAAQVERHKLDRVRNRGAMLGFSTAFGALGALVMHLIRERLTR
jgi:hypothetical protein